MKRVLFSEIAMACRGHLFGADGEYTSISTDTRNIQPGSLFVALKGERFDAHDFIDQAVAAGVAAVMVEKEHAVSVPQIIVADTRLALGALAKLWRNQFTLPLLAITGSNGKTTVKEMLASILSTMGETLVTAGNLNNEIGVPLTLLNLQEHHRFAVVELGANHVGEIKYLASLAQPHTALINNAAAAHLEGFGSIENVAEAKAEIFSALDASGYAIINADDAFAGYWRDKASHCRQLEFGMQANADISGKWLPESNRLLISTKIGQCEVELQLLGEHNARNAIAAAAAALTIGAGLNEIKLGLEGMRPVDGRLVPRVGVGGVKLLDDTYNANPASLSAALRVLSTMPGENWLILGDMAELGPQAEQLHEQMGSMARRIGVQKLFAVGTLVAAAVEAFGVDAKHFDDADALVAAVQECANPNVNILIKGSRAMRMEHIVAKLLNGSSAGGAEQDSRQ